MEFVHSKNIIHRDLALRNLLLQEVDGRLIPKVADFGLSADGDPENFMVKSGQKFPVR